MNQNQRTFIDLAIARTALRFGTFRLKSGRDSPYFFNAGLFNDGASIAGLGRCYATALIDSELRFDMLFGPAYKGIPLVTSTALALATEHSRNLPFAFNRKEAKTHGEGGQIVGSPIAGRVVIVDDVITAGTAVRESIALIREAGATPVAVLLAVDRQERGQGERSAVQEVEAEFGLQCISILTLDALIDTLPVAQAGRARDGSRISAEQLAALRKYRDDFGVV